MREARRWEGRPYCFDGGNESGPTLGKPDPETGPDHGLFCGIEGYDHSETPGFDCTGLTLYAVYQATKDVLAHDSYQAREAIADYHPKVISNESELQPGDIVYFGGSLNDFVHAGIYVGGGSFVSAVTEYIGVTTETMKWEQEGANGLKFVGALRFSGATTPGGGWDVAFQANTGELWEVGNGAGSLTAGALKLGMMPGTSPAIATTPGGGWDIAFQANTGELWEVGNGGGSLTAGALKLGMA